MPEVGGVREYDRIRRFLSRIYLYGFFSRRILPGGSAVPKTMTMAGN